MGGGRLQWGVKMKLFLINHELSNHPFLSFKDVLGKSNNSLVSFDYGTSSLLQSFNLKLDFNLKFNSKFSPCVSNDLEGTDVGGG